MKHSLYYKFILGYLVFGVLGFFAVATTASELTYNQLISQESETLYDEANLLAARYSQVYKGRNFNMDSARPQLEAVATYLKAEIWVVNSRGVVVVDSGRSPRVGMTITGFDPTFNGNRQYTIGNYNDCFQIEDSRDGFLNILYIVSGIIFGLSLIILLVFTKTVYLPLKKITEAANQYAEGNLKYKTTINTQDEMGYLAATLNYMSDELDKMEEYQRTFIANISHDFRSPLTSIKGYLEAILDGTIPPEMYEKYLNRVISETDRLNKLTQGLLTLNSLDSKGYLSRTNFDMNRVIKDTAASFEGTCDTKNIVLDLTFSENITLVYADLGKIQQVLYNLIDNAIKFSHPDSVIYIQTTVKYEKVFVSVKDTGIGIPKGSLKKIWERFYKTDQSRGKDKRGTGLGLAIVKEIIQNHGETIDVISTEGVGTEFIFTLPRATVT